MEFSDQRIPLATTIHLYNKSESWSREGDSAPFISHGSALNLMGWILSKTPPGLSFCTHRFVVASTSRFSFAPAVMYTWGVST